MGPDEDGAPRSGARPSDAEKLLDLLGVRRGHHDGAGQGTRLAGRLVLHQVALAGVLARQLPGTGDLEALARTLVRLVLRHGAVVSSSLALPCAVWAHGERQCCISTRGGKPRDVLVSVGVFV